MEKLLLLCYLLPCSWQDIKRKEISKRFLFGGGLAVLCYKMCFLKGTVKELMVGILPGLGLLFLAWMTKEAIGYGDGVIVLTMGVLLGAKMAFGVLWLALLLAAVFSVICLLQKRCKKSSTYPFVPFLLAAWTMIWVGGMV